MAGGVSLEHGYVGLHRHQEKEFPQGDTAYCLTLGHHEALLSVREIESCCFNHWQEEASAKTIHNEELEGFFFLIFYLF